MDSALGKVLSGPEVSNDFILESLLEGVAIVDAGGRIAFINATAAKMLGATAADLVGRRYDVAFFGAERTDAELADCPVNFALVEGAVSHMPDGVFIRGDGSDFLAEYVCTPLYETGRIAGTMISFQDVTQQREFERAVADARDAALAAAKAKAAFLANISHEIRTPLSGIVGTANLLAETKLSAEQANYVEMLKQSIGSLLDTVNDILDFSKIEAGKLRLHLGNFDLRKLIDETMTLYRSSAEQKGLRFDSMIDPALSGLFRGDSARLRQVINNLISNALKFTDKGGVSVSVKRDPANADVIRFEVADSGIGIEESKLPELFKAFTQGDDSTTRRFGGTGLGLAISRELIEMMNGEIGVESRLGEGSRFWFTVRLTPAYGHEALESIHISESPSDRFRVLVAEDHEISGEIIRKLLEHSGCRVTIAQNGADASEIAARSKFDLILMDCQMPEMDGYSAAGRIRQSNGPNSDTKIIALSAHAEEIERANSLRAGLDDFLCKPLTRESLARMFEKHFPDSFRTSNLDLSSNLLQHFLTKHVTPEVSENFRSIEARGEKNFVGEIFQTYFDFSGNEIAKIEEDVQLGNYDSVRRRAHALKGSSANVGLASMTALCDRLQRSDDERARVVETAAAVRHEFERIREDFDKL